METNTPMDISDCPEVGTPSQDDTYYFDPMVFEVEDTRFRVPTIQFINTQCLKTMPFTVHADLETNTEVLVLNGVNKADFKAFLKVMYPLPHFGGDISHTEDDWASVLRLSSEWGVIELRKAAVAALLSPEVPAITKVRLSQECQVPALVRAGYSQILKRDTPLLLSEAEKIGLEPYVRLVFAREYYLKQFRSAYDKRGWISYDGTFTSPTASPDRIIYNATKEEFNGILRPLEFLNIDGVALLQLAHKCKVAEWLETAYRSLVKRDTFLTLAEALQLDLSDLVSIARAREASFRTMGGLLSSNTSSDVESLFDYEKAMQVAEKAMYGAKVEEGHEVMTWLSPQSWGKKKRRR